MDNRTPEKVRFLADAGFRQVVLARELSLQEIRRIHEACPETPLEVFVHGALCVSYSGQCYVSQACFGRSANRGECAQFCRLPFSLVDAHGKTIVRDKHLLSLKDLNQSEVLEDLLDAGALPQNRRAVEGRFLCEERYGCLPQQAGCHLRPSQGVRTCFFGDLPFRLHAPVGQEFQPRLHPLLPAGPRPGNLLFRYAEVFGRGDGYDEEQRGNYLTVAGVKPFHNGDGVCFLDEQGRLQGFRINRVDGNKLYPAGDVPRIKPRTPSFPQFRPGI